MNFFRDQIIKNYKNFVTGNIDYKQILERLPKFLLHR